jgi:small redox-active disulfide protein 2
MGALHGTGDGSRELPERCDAAGLRPSTKEIPMEVKVLGTGCCGSCGNTVALIEQVAQSKGVTVAVEKVEDVKEMMRYGVMSTPGVVIDGKVVHAGGVPSRDKVAQWLEAAQAHAGR